MSDRNPSELAPAVVFDGGDLDCGSGLALLIRQHMLEVPVGEVLELRSREITVCDDLPPWCRLSKHEYLGSLPGDNTVRFFVRKGGAAQDAEALEADKARANDYEWRLRTRSTGTMRSAVYCRNFQWTVGQAASFEERDAHPSAVEYLLGALGASLSTGFATECARDGLEVDDIELTVRGQLHSVMAHLGLEDGDPGLRRATLRCFATSFDDEAAVRAAWDRAVARSPIVATLQRATALEIKLVIL
jgi:TusA-related sulfurtransferase